LTIGTYS